MAFSFKQHSEQELINIGKRYNSLNVARESSEAVARWKRDVSALACFGHGAKQLEAFEAMVAKHLAQMEAHPSAVTTKRAAVSAKNADFRAAQAWLDKTAFVLSTAAQKDPALALRLQDAVPEDVSELPGRVGTLKALLTEAKPLSSDDAQVDDRIAEADAIAKKLSDAPGTVSSAKAAKVGDTAELDYLDGQLVVAIRKLNDAASKAIRSGELDAEYSEYRLNHLRHDKRASQPADPSEPVSDLPAD